MGIFTIVSGLLVTGIVIAFGLVAYAKNLIQISSVNPMESGILIIGVGLIAMMYVMFKAHV